MMFLIAGTGVGVGVGDGTGVGVGVAAGVGVGVAPGVCPDEITFPDTPAQPARIARAAKSAPRHSKVYRSRGFNPKHLKPAWKPISALELAAFLTNL